MRSAECHSITVQTSYSVNVATGGDDGITNQPASSVNDISNGVPDENPILNAFKSYPTQCSRSMKESTRSIVTEVKQA